MSTSCPTAVRGYYHWRDEAYVRTAVVARLTAAALRYAIYGRRLGGRFRISTRRS
jgi:hypothetical protein